ncbi:MAG: ABC transporter substrate-binding protein [Trueperaceae bacterium]|nr:ABC transporter substrate-binding protein [Trueperaceae bacterium]
MRAARSRTARVRRALNFGLDRFGIIEAIFSGQANPAPGFIVEGNLGYDPDTMQPFPYDPERASELLAEAGYPDGFEITMGCPADGYININEVCQAIASNLGEIGVDVEVDFQTTNSFWSEPNYAVTGPMYVDSWSSEFGEAYPRLEGALMPGNYYNTWEDEEIASLIQEIEQRGGPRGPRRAVPGDARPHARGSPVHLPLPARHLRGRERGRGGL